MLYSLGSGNAVEFGSGIYDMPINTQNVFSAGSGLPLQSTSVISLGGLLRIEWSAAQDLFSYRPLQKYFNVFVQVHSEILKDI